MLLDKKAKSIFERFGVLPFSKSINITLSNISVSSYLYYLEVHVSN